jgi:PEP-CTERM motif
MAEMEIRIASLMLFCLAFMPSSSAQVLYDDGPINGTTNAYTINFGYVVSDTITLAHNATVGGFDLGVWEYPGDQTLTVDWSITSEQFGGTIYGMGTASVTDSFISVNQYGYDIDKLSAAISGPALNAGTYWLNLQNAVTKQGNPLYWDQNSGVGCKGDDGMGGGCPSQACDNTCLSGAAGIPPESFDILGTTGQTPEPSTFVLFGSGILGMAGVVRHKLRKST